VLIMTLCVGTCGKYVATIQLSEFIKIFFNNQQNTSYSKMKSIPFVSKAGSLLLVLNFFTPTMFDILNYACYTLNLFPA
jgi:hypothetical protein